MADDIVTRLREAHEKVLPDFYCNNLRFDACYEIERLRAELQSEKQTCQNWVKVAELMLPYVMQSLEFAGKFAPYVMTQFTKQAVHGEE